MLMNKIRLPKVYYSSRWQWPISYGQIRFSVNVSLALQLTLKRVLKAQVQSVPI